MCKLVNRSFLILFIPLLPGKVKMEERVIKKFDEIMCDVSKIQVLCQIAIDPAEADTTPELQTVMYIILDYADRIKSVASSVID